MASRNTILVSMMLVGILLFSSQVGAQAPAPSFATAPALAPPPTPSPSVPPTVVSPSTPISITPSSSAAPFSTNSLISAPVGSAPGSAPAPGPSTAENAAVTPSPSALRGLVLVGALAAVLAY